MQMTHVTLGSTVASGIGEPSGVQPSKEYPSALLCSMWSPEVFSPQYLVTIMVFAVVFEHFHPLGQPPGLGSSLLEKERR